MSQRGKANTGSRSAHPKNAQKKSKKQKASAGMVGLSTIIHWVRWEMEPSKPVRTNPPEAKRTGGHSPPVEPGFPQFASRHYLQ